MSERGGRPRNVPGFARPRRFVRRGLLVAGEGLDGAGKTTISHKLADTLRAEGREVVVSNWNDTTEMYNLMMQLNEGELLTPAMRCIFAAAELAARYEYVVLPALERGALVIVNKYLVSGFAHALARGHELRFVQRVYGLALEPDLTLYFDLPPEATLARKVALGEAIGFWEAALDLADPAHVADILRRYRAGRIPHELLRQSFLQFQTRLYELHRDLLPAKAARIDATQSLEQTYEAAERAVRVLLTRPVAPQVGTSYPIRPLFTARGGVK